MKKSSQKKINEYTAQDKIVFCDAIIKALNDGKDTLVQCRKDKTIKLMSYKPTVEDIS